MSSPSVWRLVAALVGWVVIPGGDVSPDAPAPQAAPGAEKIVVLAASPSTPSLADGYRLSVVPLPLAPQHGGTSEAAAAAAREPAEQAGCPIELRAIIVAESASDSFAIASIDGSSVVLRAGDGFRAGGSLMSVASLTPGAVVVRRGESTVRCLLSQ